MMWLSKAWMTFPDETFTNVFRKCKVSEEVAASAIADDDNPFARLEEYEEDAVNTLATDLNFLTTNCSDKVDTDLSIDEYIDFDRELSTNQSILTDKDIIHEVLGNSTDVSSDEDDMKGIEVEFIRKPLIEEATRAMEMLNEFSLYSEFGKGIMKSVREVNHYVNKEEQKTRKQSNIRDFLS